MKRNANGKFARGNAGGPGRPRRPVEIEYLAALNGCVSLEDWQGIVKKARDDATAGCWRSREWLAKYLLGDEPRKLIDVVAGEISCSSVERAADQEIRDKAFLISTARLIQADQ